MENVFFVNHFPKLRSYTQTPFPLKIITKTPPPHPSRLSHTTPPLKNLSHKPPSSCLSRTWFGRRSRRTHRQSGRRTHRWSRCRTPCCWGALLWLSSRWTRDCNGFMGFEMCSLVVLGFDWVGFVVIIGCDDLWVYGFFYGFVVASGGFGGFFLLKLWWDFAGLWWLVVAGGGDGWALLGLWWLENIVGFVVVLFLFFFLRCAKYRKIFGKKKIIFLEIICICKHFTL